MRCRKWYAKVHGVSELKITKARRMAKVAGPDATWKRAAGKLPSEGQVHETGKGDHAYTFWSLFFDKLCQRPNEDIRLFPANKTMDDIWLHFFTPWWKHQGHPEAQKPTKGTWQKMRSHKDFKDVKRRAKHFHLRCTTCATLQKKLQLAWVSADAMQQYIKERRRHEEAILKWRLLEACLDAEAIQCPEELIYLSFDATTAMHLPRLTNRPIKAFHKGGMGYTPWLITNHGRREKDYIYLPQGKWIKGGNYVITQVMAMLRRIKSDPSNPQHKARRLVMVADNAGENKNNTFLAFAADLVSQKWFDNVEFLFGEVGHTHNGNDATHKIHNQDLGNQESGDLGHLIWNYRFPWKKAQHRPRASILDVMFDWDAFYNDHKRPLSGFTKTSWDSLIVRAFKACRQRSGIVEILWKVDPATDKYWRGEDGYQSHGFHMLKSIPLGAPLEIAASGLKASLYAHQLTKEGLAETLEPWGLKEAIEANLETIETGIVKVHEQLEATTPLGQWGPLCLTGSHAECKGEVRYINRSSVITRDASGNDSLWHLPDECFEGRSLQYHVSQDDEAITSRPLPCIRYTQKENGAKNPAKGSMIYNHANNVASRGTSNTQQRDPAKKRRGKSNKDTPSDSESEQGDWEGDNFVVSMDGISSGDYAVLKCETEEVPPRTFIEVGKIYSMNHELKALKTVALQCTKDPYSQECFKGQWNLTSNRATNADAASVICYIVQKDFSKKNRTFKQDAIDAILKRKILPPHPPAKRSKAVDDEAGSHSDENSDEDVPLGKRPRAL